jgi:hypothetical protein
VGQGGIELDPRCLESRAVALISLHVVVLGECAHERDSLVSVGQEVAYCLGRPFDVVHYDRRAVRPRIRSGDGHHRFVNLRKDREVPGM